MTNISDTLTQRGVNYGLFSSQARIAQNLKHIMEETKGWSRLSDDKKEALHMIQHKIARILNGNPDLHDSWHDISGYATLVANDLASKSK